MQPRRQMRLVRSHLSGSWTRTRASAASAPAADLAYLHPTAEELCSDNLNFGVHEMASRVRQHTSVTDHALS